MIARRFPYRDGVGVLRCNACLKVWAACSCRQPEDVPPDDTKRAIRAARRRGRRGKEQGR